MHIYKTCWVKAVKDILWWKYEKRFCMHWANMTQNYTFVNFKGNVFKFNFSIVFFILKDSCWVSFFVCGVPSGVETFNEWSFSLPKKLYKYESIHCWGKLLFIRRFEHKKSWVHSYRLINKHSCCILAMSNL